MFLFFFFEIAWSSTERSATRALRVPLGRPEVASPRGGLLCGTLMVIGYRWVVACVRSAGIIFMTTHRLCAVYHSDVRRYAKDCSCLAMPKNPSLRKIERRKKRHGAICCNYCFFVVGVYGRSGWHQRPTRILPPRGLAVQGPAKQPKPAFPRQRTCSLRSETP